MGIFDVFSSGPQQEAERLRQAALERGYQQYSDLVGQGRGAIDTNYTAALQPWMTFQGTAQGGADAYADASGARGLEGLDRARSNFQAGPGFEFALNRGIDALSRAGVARGQATGNTLRDAQEFGTGLGNQEWWRYVAGLQPFLGAAATGAGGVGNVYTGKGNALAGLYGQQGQAALGTQQAIGNSQANAALADYTASANLWDFGLEAVKTAASFINGGGGKPQMPGSGPYPKLFG